jgi:MFS family permease
MRGRVFGLTAAISFSAIPAGRLLGGFLIDAIGLTILTMVIAALFALASIAILLTPALRGLDNTAGAEHASVNHDIEEQTQTHPSVAVATSNTSRQRQ